ncbi:MAG: outer membrane protein assembly factor BamA [bacterium]|nr:outer membrane protein assembly factor BamA [bacterium]
MFIIFFLYSIKVKNIEVTGVIFKKKSDVLELMNTKKGKPFNEKTLELDAKRIMESGEFEDVKISTKQAVSGDVIVVVEVVEKPVLKSVEIKGNKNLSTSKIKEAITLKAADVFDKFKAEGDVSIIKSLYYDEGFSKTDVQFYTTKDVKSKKLVLTYFIIEGEKILVSSITITGNKYYSNRYIGLKMKTKPKKVFKETVLYEDIDKIKMLYKTNGFSNAVVDYIIDYATYGVNINIYIEEGDRYKVGSVELLTQELISQKEFRKKHNKLKKGSWFNVRKFDETINSIKQVYADSGYLEPEVVTSTEEVASFINVKITVKKGRIFYIDGIFIQGLKATKPKVIKREILLKENDVFSSEKLRRSVQKIYNLGFIDEVNVDMQTPSAPDRVDLVFEIKEGRPGMLTAGAGYSTVDGLLGTMQVTHLNLFGLAQNLSLMWEFGERRQNYDITWREPWLFDRPLSFTLSLFNTERIEQFGVLKNAYRLGRRGFGFGFGPRFSEFWSLLINYSFEENRTFNIDPSITDLVKEASLRTSAIATSIVRDTRDYIFDPSYGSRFSYSMKLAGSIFGGDIHYIRNEFSYSRFIPTFWKFVLVGAIRTGFIKEIPPMKEVPSYERWLMGGADTVRGYDLGQIGPAERGKFMIVSNIEYKFPLVQEKERTILSFAVFFDIGGSWLDPNDIKWQIAPDDRSFRRGIGFGLRFTTPAFPVRLDWGYALDQKPGLPISQFYFTLGGLF